MAPNPANLPELREQFENYAIECEQALDIVMAQLRSLQKTKKRSKTERNPYDTIQFRLKSFESTVDKCIRKREKYGGGEVSIAMIRKNVSDVAGIRIITPFRDDIYSVVEELKRQPRINITEETDYVKEPKPNGYQSFHAVANVEIYHDGISKLVPVEIQIRDKAMEAWSSIEHIIQYKNPNPSEEIRSRMAHISEMLSAFDTSAIELRSIAGIV